MLYNKDYITVDSLAPRKEEGIIVQTGMIKKYLLIGIGCLSLCLGVIGLFLPLLPTTPFLLLTSYCFIRSSTRLHNWLIHHRILGSYIYNYLTYRAVKRRTKILALLLLWSSLALSSFGIQILYIKLLLLVVGIGVSAHILSLHTLK
ncbi:putative membrane protein [Propionispora sp. 2/2-37]|uniref:YbaN family protein n=1 Tax=Propionispora sp. 2/2-37 TaxID=1677858 RepID=UPI0006BEBD1B|nr:YbaN family protein [Propionispora sp. 2/2-37]CUH94697.1 putative membrane protein [Propionispora sp. 2/2-37]